MSETYRGFKVVARKIRPDGSGTDPIVEGRCVRCKRNVQRSRGAAKLASRQGRGFCCTTCNAEHTVEKRQAKVKKRFCTGKQTHSCIDNFYSTHLFTAHRCEEFV